jgi:hypothetical protein
MDNTGEPPARRPFVPLMDRLGQLCTAGRESAQYLWQVPGDESVRHKIADLLTQIKAEVAKSGRREMIRITDEMLTAIAATPSPQQAEILQDGFDRLLRLWQAAKSGLF